MKSTFAKKKSSLVAISVAFSFSSIAMAQAPEVKIGAPGPLTGGLAHIGSDSENGVLLAVEEINAKGLTIGGKSVKLVVQREDDAADPRQATQVAQKLIDDKVVAVVGHLTSGTSIPASHIYHDAGVVEITPSATNPLYTQQGFNNTFRVIATDAQQGPALAAYATKQMHAKSIAVVDDATAYGQGLADQFAKSAEALGATILSRDASTDKTIDFKGILTKIKNENPDIIMYGGSDAAGANLVRQAVQLGIRAKVVSGDGMCTEKFQELAGADSDKLVCSEAGLPLEQMPGGGAFQKRYLKRFNQPIQGYAPFAYDAVYVIVSAMQRANSTDRDKILAAMPTTNYDGVIGRITFDNKGDLKDTAISVYAFKGEKKILLDVVR